MLAMLWSYYASAGALALSPLRRGDLATAEYMVAVVTANALVQALSNCAEVGYLPAPVVHPQRSPR